MDAPVVVHPRVSARHPEITDGDARRCQWVVAMSSLNASVGVR